VFIRDTNWRDESCRCISLVKRSRICIILISHGCNRWIDVPRDINHTIYLYLSASGTHFLLSLRISQRYAYRVYAMKILRAQRVKFGSLSPDNELWKNGHEWPRNFQKQVRALFPLVTRASRMEANHAFKWHSREISRFDRPIIACAATRRRL